MAAKKPVVKKAAPKSTAKIKPVKKADKKTTAVKPVKKAAVKAVPVKKTVKVIAVKKTAVAKAPSKAIKTKHVTKVKKVESVKKTVKQEKVVEVKKAAVAPVKVVKTKPEEVKAKTKETIKEIPKVIEKAKKPEPVKVPEKVKIPEKPKAPEKAKVIEKPKPTKLRYTREELDEFKKIILEKQSEAINNLQTLRDQMLDPSTGEYINENSPYSLHMAEQGTDAMEKEKNYFYAQREQKFLGYLEEALKRIEAGTYGLCKDCADDPKMLCPTCPLIPKERLEAVPHSQQCVQLKKMQEKPRLR